MSSLDTTEQLAKGRDSFLSPEERLTVQRYLSKPDEFPPEFGAWILEYVRTQGQPINQQLGAKGFPRFIAADRAPVTVGSTTTETDLFVTKLPAKTVAQGGYLELALYFTAMCSDASNQVALSCYANGVSFSGVSISTSSLDEIVRPGKMSVSLNNLGVYDSQFLERHLMFLAVDTVKLDLTTVDLSEDVDLKMTAKWNGAGTQSFVKLFASASVFNPIGV